MRNLELALGVVAAVLLPHLAAGHEVTHEVVYGRAVAVRARYAGEAPLANAEYQVFSPADPKTPWQKGRTDREGWLAFVPGETGTWRVQVVDGAGHGMILSVTARPPPASEPEEGTLRWVLRLLALAGAAALAYAALAAARGHRRSGAATR